MKIKNIAIYFISCLLGCHLAVIACAAVDKIVVTVDNTPIMQSELNKKIAMLRSRGNNMDSGKLRQLVLDELIDTTLLLNLAHRRGITIGEKQLDMMIANIAKSNGITVAQLKDEVKNREHISFEEFRRQLRIQTLINEVQHQALGQEISISDQDIAAVLKSSNKMTEADTQYQLTDIIFTLPENISQTRLAAVNNLAKELAKKLQNKADIESSMEETRKKLQFGEALVIGKDMGWRRIVDLPEIFVQEVVKLQKIGQVIGPINAPNGLHLLRLNDLNSGARQLTKEQAANIAYAKKMTEKTAPFIKELRSKAYIKIH
jgi:peptidyl-prolyl cis-trans isomerase SurA